MDSDTREFNQQDVARGPSTLVVEAPPAPSAPIPPAAWRPSAPPVPYTPPAPAPTAGPPVPTTPLLPPAATPSPWARDDSTMPSPTKAAQPIAAPTVGGNSNIIPFVLIVVGALLLFTPLNLGDLFGSAIVLVIGLVFLYAYSQGRHFGFLVPGAIMTGLGLGIVTESMTGSSGWVPLGLGLGFCAIWATHRAHWWALIPGGIIALAGLQDLVSSAGWAREMWYGWSFNGAGWWPLFLVLAGIWLIASRNRVSKPN